MKIITLNVWGGKLYEPLMQFLKIASVHTDIFCFQDVLFGSEPEFSPMQKGRINLFSEMQNVLPDFDFFVFRDSDESYIHGEFLAPDVGCGQVIFVKKSIQVLESGGFRSHPNSPYHTGGDIVSGRCQWITFVTDDNIQTTVMNFHGLWQKDSQKRDTSERIEQSQKIKEFLDARPGKKILCGDFNLAKDTESIRILEEGMINLITKYCVVSTRNRYYSKEEKLADYILVSQDIVVSDFRVLPDEVSDHLPLLLQYN